MRMAREGGYNKNEFEDGLDANNIMYIRTSSCHLERKYGYNRG